MSRTPERGKPRLPPGWRDPDLPVSAEDPYYQPLIGDGPADSFFDQVRIWFAEHRQGGPVVPDFRAFQTRAYGPGSPFAGLQWWSGIVQLVCLLGLVLLLVRSVSTRIDPKLLELSKLPLSASNPMPGVGAPLDRARLAIRFLESSQLSEAARALESADGRPGMEWQTRLGLAKLALKTRQSEAALELARSLAAERPSDPDVLNTLGVILAQSGRPMRALSVFETAMKVNPRDALLRWNAGSAAGLADRWDLAERYARDAVVLAPDEATHRILLAVALIKQGRRRDGVAELEAAVRRTPRNTEAIHFLARVSLAGGENARALTLLKRAQQISPAVPDFYVDAGVAAIRAGLLDEAVRQFVRLRELDRNVPDAWLGLAEVAERRGQVGLAIDSYERALSLQPDLMLAANNLAFHYAEQGKNLMRARELSLLVVRARPLSAAAQDTHAWVCFKSRRLVEAAAFAREAVRLNGGYAGYQRHLATILRAMGKLEEAERVSELAADIKAPARKLPDSTMEVRPTRPSW